MSKRKYLVLFRGEPGQKQDGPSPEEMQKMFAAYEAWMEEFADDIVDMGAKLSSSGRVVSSSGVADGPFVEAKEVVGGYMILSTEGYDAAVEVMNAGPAGQVSRGSFEIRELMDMGER